MQEIYELKPGPKLYAFYNSPPLDTVSTWSEKIIVSVPADSHQACSNIDSFASEFFF